MHDRGVVMHSIHASHHRKDLSSVVHTRMCVVELVELGQKAPLTRYVEIPSS